MTSVPQNMSSAHDSGATPTVAPSTAPKSSDAQSPNPTESSNDLSQDSNSQSQAPPSQDSSYPEQKHAGAVGYGPNYRKNPTIEEKIEGLKEELKGKITRKPELVQHGRDIRSGEERRRKLEGEDEPNPFQSVDEDEKKVNPHGNDLDQPTGQQAQQSPGMGASPQSQSTDQFSYSQQTPQTRSSGQSEPLQAAPGASPSLTFQDNRSQSQSQSMNTSGDMSAPPSSIPSSQETTGTRPEPASHGAPRANPAGMALDQGYGQGAKEQAATVAPAGTREAEQQRKGNEVPEFAARPVDARQ